MNAPKPPARMPVLVVEDELLVRIFMADFLEEAGFKVFEAVNADEAIVVLEARPDVQAVITDIEMPGSMNGLALAKAIHQRWPRIGIIVTSGRKRPAAGELPVSCRKGMPFWPSLSFRRLSFGSFSKYPRCR
jgi:two-component system, response regulator PdtaR